MAIGDTWIGQVDAMNEVGCTVVRCLGKGVLRLYSDFSGLGGSMLGKVLFYFVKN